MSIDKLNIKYPTNIIDPTIEKVIALGDFHGDIDALIISLRDCAQVIKKKVKFQFDQTVYDSDLNEKLNENLNDSFIDKSPEEIENAFINNPTYTLNYEWVSTNTYVVICGDIIDPAKFPGNNQKNRLNCINRDNNPCHWRPQIELKILMFINSLNVLAEHKNSKIIKLIGNHELDNMCSNPILQNYSLFSSDIRLNNTYFNGVTRKDIFKYNKFGFRLLRKDGIRALVKINNFVFVHGELGTMSYNKFVEINGILNSTNQQLDIDKLSENKVGQLGDRNNLTGPLWSRRSNYTESSPEMCDSLKTRFIDFCKDSELTDCANLSLVVGHCIQSGNMVENATTYIENNTALEAADIFTPPIYTGVPDFTQNAKTFGITIDCKYQDSNNKDRFRIYRIDVGASRGTDFFNEADYLNMTKLKQHVFIYSKTPQVLHILFENNEVSIIKSTIGNTRIHLPRDLYEQFIIDNKLTDLFAKKPGFIEDIEDIDGNDLHLRGYLKYKNKYLRLKYM